MSSTATATKPATRTRSTATKARTARKAKTTAKPTVGSEGRKAAETVAARVAKGETVPAIAEDLNVSMATARRFLTNLTLAHDVEAGRFDKAWKPGAKELVVHTVSAKATGK